MGQVQWRLRELLSELNLPALHVEAEAQRLGHSLGRNAVYRLLRRPPERVALRTLAALLDALTSLSGRTITTTDLIRYETGGLPNSRSSEVPASKGSR